MPHLIETYALNCGLKIGEPSIIEKFYPINLDKYITFHPNSKYDSKSYDYWQEVLDIIAPPLKEMGISIVQIGSKGDRPFNYAQHTQGSTNIGQVAYILNGAQLHLGVDSFPTHVASSYRKKIVCLYSNTYADIVGPYWGDEKDHILLEPTRTKENPRPSYSAQESPKTINDIKPEDIADSVFKLLGCDYRYEYKTLTRGATYLSKQIESIPDSVVDINKLGTDSLIVRMDYHFDEHILLNQIARNPCTVVTDKPIDLTIFKNFKKNLVQLVYKIDENHDPDFAESCYKEGLNVLLLTELDDEGIEKAKLYYMDHGIINKKATVDPKDVEKIKKFGLKNLFYKSNKFLVSEGKVYPSVAAWKEKKPTDKLYPQVFPIIDDESFWDRLDEYYILKK
tara:strand:- start:1125 stop:2309 length:1185 start_codon:yes stop_codon:yes gene_type:complete